MTEAALYCCRGSISADWSSFSADGEVVMSAITECDLLHVSEVTQGRFCFKGVQLEKCSTRSHRVELNLLTSEIYFHI